MSLLIVKTAGYTKPKFLRFYLSSEGQLYLLVLQI